MPARPAKTQKPAAAKSAAPAKSTKKETKAAAPAPVAEGAAPVQNTVVAAEQDPIAEMDSRFAAILTKINNLSTELTAAKAELRAYHSFASKELRAARKARGKGRRQPKGDRPASGFVKPTLISNELAAFLKVPSGTEMARTEVTKALHAYIQSNNLKNKDNGRIIEANEPLKKLLKLKKDDELTYFNLQKFMTPHFSKHTTTA